MTRQPMRDDDPMRRSGAVWCTEHDRWECSHQSRRSQSRCHGNAVRGLDCCRMHAGRRLDLARTQGEANLLAWSAEAASESTPLNPGRVVMDQLRVAVLRADVYGELLRLQVADEEIDGLVGPTFAVGRDGQKVETGERVRGLAALEAEWRDRVVRFAKAAHDMGIAEAVVELEKQRAELVTGAFLAAIDVLGLLPVDRSRVVEVFLDRLGSGEPVAGEVIP